MDRNQILNDPETAMRYALHGLQSQIWTAIPALVTSVDLAAMTIECQPTIKGVFTDQNGNSSYVNLPLLVDVPIVFPSAGGFILTLPIQSGDEVLIIFSSRCIDAWWQSGGVQPPMELRMHDLSDGFAIPGPKSKPNVVSSISSSSARLMKDDGSVYLEITPSGGINMLAPAGVTINGNVVLTGNITMTGDIGVTGKIDASGNITSQGGIGLSSHKHTGVTPGGGTSGGPTP